MLTSYREARQQGLPIINRLVVVLATPSASFGVRGRGKPVAMDSHPAQSPWHPEYQGMVFCRVILSMRRMNSLT